MYACAVACVALDIDRAAAHSVARGVADVAVDDYLARVHRVAHGVLRVGVNGDSSSVEVSAERIARHTLDVKRSVRHTRSDKALTADSVKDGHILLGAYLLVYLAVG